MVEHANRQAEPLSESTSSTCSSRKHSNRRRRLARMPLFLVTSALLILVVVLSACGGSSASTGQATPTVKKHATGCTPQSTLPGDVANPPAAFDTGANVIANFNFA